MLAVLDWEAGADTHTSGTNAGECPDTVLAWNVYKVPSQLLHLASLLIPYFRTCSSYAHATVDLLPIGCHATYLIGDVATNN